MLLTGRLRGGWLRFDSVLLARMLPRLAKVAVPLANALPPLPNALPRAPALPPGRARMRVFRTDPLMQLARLRVLPRRRLRVVVL